MNLFKALPLLLAPAPVLAHVKWFVPTGHEAPPDLAAFALTEPAVQIWLLLALLLVAASLWLDSRLPRLPQPHGIWRSLIMSSLPVLTGLSLLLSTWSGNVIAPHFAGDDSSMRLLLGLQGLAAALLLLPGTVWYGALCLVVLHLGLFLRAGPLAALEYLNVLAIAGFLLLQHHPNGALRERLQAWAVPVLRIGTGLALITLAFSEKLLRPDYAETFVQTYMWNFMYNLGFESYSDRLFVLSAGAMEAVLGTILVLGTTTRLNILVISGFMLTSNLTFFVQDNLQEALTEIIGHLPIIAIAIICVCFGAGQRLKASTLLCRTNSPMLPQSRPHPSP